MADGTANYATAYTSKTVEFELNRIEIGNPTMPQIFTPADHHQHAVLPPVNPYYQPMLWQQTPNGILAVPNIRSYDYWAPNQSQTYHQINRQMTVIERSVVYNYGNMLIHDYERYCYYNQYNSQSLHPYAPY